MKTKIFFDHIYKAAGTSVDRLLLERVGTNAITPGLDEPAASALRRFADRRVITGHFSFSPGEAMDPERYYFTVLRHPVDRVLSHYYFSRNDVAVRGSNPAVELAKDLSLEDYVACEVPEVKALLRNNQAQHFAALSWDGSSVLTDEELLEAAKASLDKYDLVGVVDELEDTMRLLFADQGWPPAGALPRANVTSSRPAMTEIDLAVLRRLTSMNELDIRLHEHALRLLRGRRSAALARLASSGSHGRRAEPAASAAAPVEAPSQSPRRPREYGTRRVEVLSALVAGSVSVGHEVMSGEDVRVTLYLKAHEAVEGMNVGIRITDADGRIVFGQNLRGQGMLLDAGPGEFTVEFQFKCALGYGDYAVSAALHSQSSALPEYFHWKDEAAWISVIANLGNSFEGYVKLEPRIVVHNPQGSAVAGTRVVDEGSQFLALQGVPLADFRSDVVVLNPPESMQASELRAIRVGIRNDGAEAWGSEGIRRVCISYHWVAIDGTLVEYDGERTPLVADVAPGMELVQWAVVKAPSRPGCHRLQVTLVQEYVAWFDASGSAPAEYVVNITGERVEARADEALARPC